VLNVQVLALNDRMDAPKVKKEAPKDKKIYFIPVEIHRLFPLY